MTKSNDNGYQLFILRHGKASTNDPCRDFDRQLTQKGINQVEQIGMWMKDHDLKPDIIITSPAKRTFMTTDIVSKVLSVKEQNIYIDSQIYGADLVSLLKVLANCSLKAHKILLVGHNPSLENLVEFLLPSHITRKHANHDRLFPVTLVHIEMKRDWSHLTLHCAQLKSFIHGKSLN
jgi:phosphohistidine phosphatase